MAMMVRPLVSVLADGGKYWEHTFEKFYLKAYVPATEIDGQVNNYTFRAPLLLVLEETRQSMEQAIAFAGIAPASALFPIKDNPFGKSLGDPGLNMSVPV